MAKALGKHIVGEFFGCKNLPKTAEELKDDMEHCAKLIGATVVQSVFHEFNPHGLSGVVVISESHLAIHTWPEFNCASVDIFTCCDDIDAVVGFKYLAHKFESQKFAMSQMDRGVLSEI